MSYTDWFFRVEFWIIFLAVATYGFAWLAGRRASPSLYTLSRWCRWLLIALALGSLATTFATQPLWALVLASFLFFFLIETGYNWLAIGQLSKSNIPLFPRWHKASQDIKWPKSLPMIRLREWLREKGFRRETYLEADIGHGASLPAATFLNAEATIRIQVVFLPTRQGEVAPSYSLSSLTQSGLRLITDNHYLPFGGFYPNAWRVERFPWRRSLPKLYQRHLERIEALHQPLANCGDNSVEDMNQRQEELEAINTERGFLMPRALRPTHGRITREGRYRLWKELWMINYLGRPVA